MERVHFTCLGTLGSRGCKAEGEGALFDFCMCGGHT
jgi:hypothetical protein